MGRADTFVEIVHDNFVGPENVGNRNTVRALTVVAAGAVAVVAELTGHPKVAKWATVYAGLQVLEQVRDLSQSGPHIEASPYLSGTQAHPHLFGNLNLAE